MDGILVKRFVYQFYNYFSIVELNGDVKMG